MSAGAEQQPAIALKHLATQVGDEIPRRHVADQVARPAFGIVLQDEQSIPDRTAAAAEVLPA
jgi:hypothetical protein